MREYGRVHSAFWSSTDAQSLSDDAKLLALYLLTCSHGTIAGVCRLPDGYVSEDLRWEPERVSKGLSELFEKGFCDRCGTTKWVWIRKFLEWNEPENPNQWKAVHKVVGQIPDKCSWKADFLEFLCRLTSDDQNPDQKGSGTVLEPFRNPTPTATASQQNTSAASPPIRGRVPRETDHPEWMLDFKLAYPNRAGSQEWRRAIKAANARMAEGHTPAEFIAGAKRYAEHCEALGKTGTEYVKQAATFLGPDKHFLEPWSIPASSHPKPPRMQPDALEVARGR